MLWSSATCFSKAAILSVKASSILFCKSMSDRPLNVEATDGDGGCSAILAAGAELATTRPTVDNCVELAEWICRTKNSASLPLMVIALLSRDGGNWIGARGSGPVRVLDPDMPAPALRLWFREWPWPRRATSLGAEERCRSAFFLLLVSATPDASVMAGRVGCFFRKAEGPSNIFKPADSLELISSSNFIFDSWYDCCSSCDCLRYEYSYTFIIWALHHDTVSSNRDARLHSNRRNECKTVCGLPIFFGCEFCYEFHGRRLI